MQKTFSNFSISETPRGPNKYQEYFLSKPRSSISVTGQNFHPHSSRISSLPQLSFTKDSSQTKKIGQLSETALSFLKKSNSKKYSKEYSKKKSLNNMRSIEFSRTESKRETDQFEPKINEHDEIMFKSRGSEGNFMIAKRDGSPQANQPDEIEEEEEEEAFNSDNYLETQNRRAFNSVNLPPTQQQLRSILRPSRNGMNPASFLIPGKRKVGIDEKNIVQLNRNYMMSFLSQTDESVVDKNPKLSVSKLIEFNEENEQYFRELLNSIEKLGDLTLKSEVDEVLRSIVQRTTLMPEVHHLQILALELCGRGALLFSDYKLAIKAFKHLRNFCIAKGKFIQKLRSYQLLSSVYQVMDNHEKAIIYLKKMLKLAWKLKNKTFESLAYDLIGLQYYYSGDLSKAKYFHEKMLNGDFEPETSMIRIIGEKSVDLKKQIKMQNYISRLISDDLMKKNTGGGHLYQSIFTDSEDDLDLETLCLNKNAASTHLIQGGEPGVSETERHHISVQNKSRAKHKALFVIEERKSKVNFRATTIFKSEKKAPIDSQWQEDKQMVHKMNTIYSSIRIIPHLSPARQLDIYNNLSQKNKVVIDFDDEFVVRLDKKNQGRLQGLARPLKIEVRKYLNLLTQELSKDKGLFVNVRKK